MRQNLSPEARMVIPMVILSVIMLYLGGWVLYRSFDNIHALSRLKNKIELSKSISSLIHDIQKERGLACGYLMGNVVQFGADLRHQRQATDRRIAALKEAFARYQLPETTRRKVEQALKPLSRITAFRARIDDGSVQAREAIRYYTRINDALLETIVDMSQDSRIPEITRNLLAYMNFMYMKEYAGIERAVVAKLLSQKSFNLRTLRYFSELIALQKEHEKMFLFYVDDAFKKRYVEVIAPHLRDAIEKVREQIFDRNVTDTKLNPRSWFDLVSRKIDALDRFSAEVEREAVSLAEERMRSLQNTFFFITMLTVISAVIFFYMIRSIWHLARQERRLRLVADKYIISSVTDPKGRIIDVSQAFCDISGYTREELVGKPHNIVRHPDMPASAFREMWAQIKQGKSWSGKVKNLKKDGGFYWVYAHIEPLFDREGRIDSYISIRLDITENELLNEKIQEEEAKSRLAVETMQQQARLAQMGEMLNMIAHQWRQPLSAISAAASALTLKGQLGNLDADTVLELARKINGFSRHLSSTIDDFRNFFRTDKEKVSTDLETIARSAITIIQSAYDRNKIELEVSVDKPCTMVTYENELKQVVLNLLTNAEDVLVDRQVEAPRVRIEIVGGTLVVEDNGGGIDAEHFDSIFDPYFSTKLQKNGTGLGLYMSKMIVEDHCGGTIRAENTDKGARFVVDLEAACE
jgi:PAS domain S-box-containing protein